ncbi:TnsA-like heteromeric transposase endonuclease subunit [Mycolicibacterium moriokaense]|uniref:TnsA-like heteromeric transposase endonuclease subunit n=1 Tax=Mycolicibacterium moriokaense TaxID=39691 RepID=UPI001F3ADA88|nr:TnsA-like heteromeric transposase endonuclease subunit [Mycolicibacterium moriokaense]
MGESLAEGWIRDRAVEVDAESATIDLRPSKGEIERSSVAGVSQAALLTARPWRTFRWYEGQRHYSGSYWAATEANHVIYESRLELSALVMADFDRAVCKIVAQPFLLQAVVNGHRRRHIPDYLLRTTTGLVVVDVVRARRLAEDPAAGELCAWTHEVIGSTGWEYRVYSEPPTVLMRNVGFLSGYRRSRYISRDALREIIFRRRAMVGLRIDDALRAIGRAGPGPLMRSALLHTLWNQEFSVDLQGPLRSSTVLGAPR